MSVKNFEVYQKSPLSYSLINNGVAKVAEIGEDTQQIQTLRFELETFVCDGEYARGIERILTAYLDGLNKAQQQAVWISGFFGSGKSHLAKMLRYLWADYKFPDGASARSIAHLPSGVKDLLLELTNRSRRFGGLQAAGGTLGAGAMDNVRLAFLQLVFRAAGLPENYAAARFTLWLKEGQLFDKVSAALTSRKLVPTNELKNFFVSMPLAEAILAADSSYGTPQNVQAAIRSQFPTSASPTIEDTLDIVRRVFGDSTQLPCTLLAVDEIQQYIGERLQRAMDVQEIAEHCCTDLNSRLLLVGTGQSALTGTASLARLQARFTIKVPLSDTDVESVIRQTVLAKKPEREADIRKAMDANQGEISRQLQNTRLAATTADEPFYAPDYPLLPVRRRFWEKVLRNVDVSGTTAQLRTQLMIVFEAARATADAPLGHVVPADYIYDQLAADLLNTGILQKEYHETIMGLQDGTPAGNLKSRLCATIFLISQLPQTGSADDGVRATPEILADLLVKDLAKDGARLRQQIPGLLEDLANQGKLMRVENEYVLQTREGAAWSHYFNNRRTQILNDEGRISSVREEVLKKAVDAALSKLSITQGVCRQPRDLDVVLSSARPTQPTQKLVLWVRHGWAEQDKVVASDARAAGNTSPMLFGFLPREAHEDFRQNLASWIAAQETIDHFGPQTLPEGIQACNAMKTILEIADRGVKDCARKVLAAARIYMGGGTESGGTQLIEKVREAAENAVQRLFSQFNDADHANWSQVLTAARGGNVGALQHVGYQGEVVRHAVCKAIYDQIGPGKKGREVREWFKAAAYGWPQDAVDAALVILTLAGNLRVTVNGQPATANSLTQTQISNASFYVDVPPLTVVQRLELKGLFQKLSIAAANGQESASAAAFLTKLLELAQSAGGDAPLPERPSETGIRELQNESGNAQLLKIHEQKDALSASIDSWTRQRGGVAKRAPTWHRLKELQQLAAALPVAAEVEVSANAIAASRGLLNDPDPVPPLIHKLVDAARAELNSWQSTVTETFAREKAKLASNEIWQQLTEPQRLQLIDQFSLKEPAKVQVANEDEIVAALRDNSLANRRTYLEAVPQLFLRAIEEAARLLVPKAVRVHLPSRTISDAAQLDSWVAEARACIESQLTKGPVIV